MPTSAARTELNHIAVELRKLAFLVPAEHEERLLYLSERLVQIGHRIQQFQLPLRPD